MRAMGEPLVPIAHQAASPFKLPSETLITQVEWSYPEYAQRYSRLTARPDRLEGLHWRSARRRAR